MGGRRESLWLKGGVGVSTSRLSYSGEACIELVELRVLPECEEVLIGVLGVLVSFSILSNLYKISLNLHLRGAT